MVNFKALAAPFPPAAVSWRIGSTTADKTRGMALAYLDARDVMDRLDEVCGPDNWECRYPHAGQKTVCDIGILCEDRWVYKANGAGDSDIEAEKGALSDAFKRAAVLWGIGRYLYNLPSPWVEIETKGRTSIIKEHEKARLADLLTKYSAGQRPAAPPPPPDEDVLAAARRWVSEQSGVLGTLANRGDVVGWNMRNTKALQKLQKTNEPLHGDIKRAYDVAFQRTAMAA